MVDVRIIEVIFQKYFPGGNNFTKTKIDPKGNRLIPTKNIPKNLGP
jgi:hypothetical protein